MADSATIEALHHARDRFNAQDEAYFELYAEDVVLHGYPGGIEDLHAAEQFYRGFWEAFPDAELVYEDILEEADRVAVRYRIRGTHRAELLGAAGTGNPVEVTGMSIFRMRDGRAVECWQALDDLGLLQQIGAIPTPA
jgi:predicted ester cyclase